MKENYLAKKTELENRIKAIAEQIDALKVERVRLVKELIMVNDILLPKD